MAKLFRWIIRHDGRVLASDKKYSGGEDGEFGFGLRLFGLKGAGSELYVNNYARSWYTYD